MGTENSCEIIACAPYSDAPQTMKIAKIDRAAGQAPALPSLATGEISAQE